MLRRRRSRLLKTEKTQDLIERLLLSSFIALTTLAFLTSVGATLKAMWAGIAKNLNIAAS